MQTNDKLIIGGHEFTSRFILGSGKYSLNLIEAAVKDAGAQIITLAVRRLRRCRYSRQCAVAACTGCAAH